MGGFIAHALPTIELSTRFGLLSTFPVESKPAKLFGLSRSGGMLDIDQVASWGILALRVHRNDPQARRYVLWIESADDRDKIDRCRAMKRITVENYRQDKFYPRVVRAVATILEQEKVVAPVEVFVQMDLLSRRGLEDWRFGRVPYLEKIIHCNLSRATRILRILRMHAHDLDMKPSHSVYLKWGKGSPRRLRFSKTGEHKLEDAYSRHFIYTRRDKPPAISDILKEG